MITSISKYQSTFLAIYKTGNGLIAVNHKFMWDAKKSESEQVQEESVFRNTEELCEWIKEYYKEIPKQIEVI